MIDKEIGLLIGARVPLIVFDKGRVKRSAWMASASDPDIRIFWFIVFEFLLDVPPWRPF